MNIKTLETTLERLIRESNRLKVWVYLLNRNPGFLLGRSPLEIWGQARDRPHKRIFVSKRPPVPSLTLQSLFMSANQFSCFSI